MVLIILVTAFGLGLVSFGFLAFTRDVSKVTGASTLTSALIYRKLQEENQLTRLQIRELRERSRSNRTNQILERRERWQAQQRKFECELELQKVSR